MTARTGPRPAELFRRAHQALAALYSTAHPDGLTMPQFAVLSALLRHGPQRRTALMGLTGMDRATVADMSKRLCAAGMAVGVRVEGAGRGPQPILLSLTPRGRRALEKAETALWNAEVRLMRRLSPQDKARFLDCLAVVAFEGGGP